MMPEVKGDFWIENIPDVMIHLNMPFSAFLQKKWFSADAYEFTDETYKLHWEDSSYYSKLPPSQCLDMGDTQIANPNGGASLGSVKWACSFERPYSAFVRFRGSLLNTTIDCDAWKVPRETIRKRLKATSALKGYQQGDTIPFGSEFLPARYQVDHFDIAAAHVALLPPQLKPNDFEASYGACSWCATVAGTAVPVGKALYSVSITHIGFYLADNFEFGGAQILGAWSRSDVLRFALPGVFPQIAFLKAFAAGPLDNGYYFASNNTYREYRSYSKKGGDFHIFSDVVWVQVDPQQFHFTANVSYE